MDGWVDEFSTSIEIKTHLFKKTKSHLFLKKNPFT
jgi:hypothetical protein